MLKELLKNKKFLKIIEESLKKQGILDIVLFGSLVKGKDEPTDIDLLIIYTGKETADIEYEIRKSLKSIDKNIEVISKNYSEIFSPEFFAREAVLAEGYSMRQKKFVSESLGYNNFILFKYALKNLNKSKRMQFYYSLYGRSRQEGILKKNKCYKFSDSIILSSIENSETIKNFLDSWKIKYVEFPVLVPKRIVKYIFLKKS